MSSSEKIANNKILAAFEEGKFDNIARKGQPIEIKEHPHIDPAQAITGQIMIEQGFSLPWLELWHDIEADLNRLIKDLELANSTRLTSLRAGKNIAHTNAEWLTFLAHFRSEILLLNKRVNEYNLQAPLPQLQKSPFIADVIISKLDLKAG